MGGGGGGRFNRTHFTFNSFYIALCGTQRIHQFMLRIIRTYVCFWMTLHFVCIWLGLLYNPYLQQMQANSSAESTSAASPIAKPSPSPVEAGTTEQPLDLSAKPSTTPTYSNDPKQVYRLVSYLYSYHNQCSVAYLSNEMHVCSSRTTASSSGHTRDDRDGRRRVGAGSVKEEKVKRQTHHRLTDWHTHTRTRCWFHNIIYYCCYVAMMMIMMMAMALMMMMMMCNAIALFVRNIRVFF